MNIQDFKRILISFADNSSDVEINRGNVTAVIRGEIIEIQVIEKDSELYIMEDQVERKAIQWIAIRLAQLEQLADRIKEYITVIKDFINPSGKLLEDIDSDPSETEIHVEDLCKTLQKSLDKKIVGTTGVVYLTSDAGEGKTTIINQLSIYQAESFKKKETTWLLVPIPLGGRPFLRFDDIVIASLVNRLRFRLFYYESFIELVKIGLIVPAFDGFEEMFMENSSGEALSATGQLMAKLNSSGNVLIAARQAYFDYKNFSSQAKLFDTIGSNSVAFSKVSIDRWDKDKFIEYAYSKNIKDGEEIYTSVLRKLGDPKHPLLTRPVLVNRLLEVVKTSEDLQRISTTLENPSEYFYSFVDAIIQREVDLKWLDTSGEPSKPLLTIEQHHDLLAIIAEEMWLNSTDSLPFDIIDLLADFYCEAQRFSVKISRQVKERLKQHALLVRSDQNINHLKFDHEEFMHFFLGISFFKSIAEKKVSNFKNLMRKGLLHKQTIDSIIVSSRKAFVALDDTINLFNSAQANEGPTSFIKETCGTLILKLLSSIDGENRKIDQYSFPPNWLVGLTLTNLIIENSQFQFSLCDSAELNNCTFENCTFAGLEIDSENLKINNVTLKDCEVLFIRNANSDLSFYDPSNIRKSLERLNFSIKESTNQLPQEETAIKIDKDLEIVERALRRFIRGSHLNDNVFRIRLGNNAEYFIDELLPILLDSGVIAEVLHIGAGSKRRFKLKMPFDKINDSLKNAKGNFKTFLENIRSVNA